MLRRLPWPRMRPGDAERDRTFSRSATRSSVTRSGASWKRFLRVSSADVGRGEAARECRCDWALDSCCAGDSFFGRAWSGSRMCSCDVVTASMAVDDQAIWD